MFIKVHTFTNGKLRVLNPDHIVEMLPVEVMEEQKAGLIVQTRTCQVKITESMQDVFDLIEAEKEANLEKMKSALRGAVEEFKDLFGEVRPGVPLDVDNLPETLQADFETAPKPGEGIGEPE